MVTFYERFVKNSGKTEARYREKQPRQRGLSLVPMTAAAGWATSWQAAAPLSKVTVCYNGRLCPGLDSGGCFNGWQYGGQVGNAFREYGPW